jgi:hypothetical protein
MGNCVDIKNNITEYNRVFNKIREAVETFIPLKATDRAQGVFHASVSYENSSGELVTYVARVSFTKQFNFAPPSYYRGVEKLEWAEIAHGLLGELGLVKIKAENDSDMYVTRQVEGNGRTYHWGEVMNTSQGQLHVKDLIDDGELWIDVASLINSIDSTPVKEWSLCLSIFFFPIFTINCYQYKVESDDQ